MLSNSNMTAIMEKARKLRILIPAFNVPYLPMVKPIIDSLKRNNCFGLVQVARPDVEKFEAGSYQKVACEYQKFADANHVRLHLDHTPVIDEDNQKVDWKSIIIEALEQGFDSVMIDGSRLSLEENIIVTREVVGLSHSRNISVEAELGAVLGHEKGHLPPYEELFTSAKGFTDPEQAEKFVNESGVDWLSVAVGNIHGAISGTAKNREKIAARINIEHLRKLRDVTNVPLVLHGGSGIHRSYVLDAIKEGISKINIGTDIRQVYEKSIAENPNDISLAQKHVAERIDR